MNKRIWDRYAPVYTWAMRSDRRTYKEMYERIQKVIVGNDVLEVATGPGLLAKHVADKAHTMVATDYSEGMIAQAKKGKYPDNLIFQIADATKLPFDDQTFDVVLMANALHIIPEPEKALNEVKRVLKKDGVFIAPNFIQHQTGLASRLWSNVLRIAGIRFEHQWDEQEYTDFLESNGWKIMHRKVMAARISLAYVECIRDNGVKQYED